MSERRYTYSEQLKRKRALADFESLPLGLKRPLLVVVIVFVAVSLVCTCIRIAVREGIAQGRIEWAAFRLAWKTGRIPLDDN